MGCIIKTNKLPPKNLELNIVTIDSFIKHGNLLKNATLIKTNFVHNEEINLKHCMKFELPSEDFSMINEEIQFLYNHSVACSEDLLDLMNFYEKFIATTSYLKFKLHAICIKDFTIEKALKILLIYMSLNLNLNNEAVSISSSFPFICFNEEFNENEIIKA